MEIQDIKIIRKDILKKVDLTEVDIKIFKNYLLVHGIKAQVHFNNGDPFVIYKKVKKRLTKYEDTNSYVVCNSFTRKNKKYPNINFLFGKGTTLIREFHGQKKYDGFLIYYENLNDNVFWPWFLLKKFLKPVVQYELETIR